MAAIAITVQYAQSGGLISTKRLAPKWSRLNPIKNAGNKHAELDFASGQRYDFVVIDSVGRPVWQWSNGRMFTQTVQNKQLGGGESMRVSETWNKASAAPGKYTVIATLKSSNYPQEQRADFVLP